MHAIFLNSLLSSQDMSFSIFLSTFPFVPPSLPPPPHLLFVFTPTTSHLLCTMPPENIWNPLKLKCVLPLKMTPSLLFSIIEPPHRHRQTFWCSASPVVLTRVPSCKHRMCCKRAAISLLVPRDLCCLHEQQAVHGHNVSLFSLTAAAWRACMEPV